MFPEKIEFDGKKYRTKNYNKVLDFIYQQTDELYESKTKSGDSFSTFSASVGCGVLFAVNIFFVPKYSYMACACGSFLGYFTAMTLSYIVGQRRNPTKYNLKDIFSYVALFAVLYGISLALPIDNSIAKMCVNTLLLLIFVAYFVKKDLPLNKIPFINRFVR